MTWGIPILRYPSFLLNFNGFHGIFHGGLIMGLLKHGLLRRISPSFASSKRDFSPQSPDVPWCWKIYLQNWAIFWVNVGKYSSTMEHLGERGNESHDAFLAIRFLTQSWDEPQPWVVTSYDPWLDRPNGDVKDVQSKVWRREPGGEYLLGYPIRYCIHNSI